MISRRRALAYSVASAVISVILVGVIGTFYLDNRIQEGIEESKVIDARVDQAFRGLCDILVFSTRPSPRPPTPENSNLPDPGSPYGRALAQYNRELAKRQAEGRAAVNAAVDRYHCRR